MGIRSNIPRALSAVDDELERANQRGAFLIENAAKRHCPVDSGRLRASITHEVRGSDGFIVGTNVTYAPFVELGTRYQSPQPYLVPAIQENISQLRAEYESAK